MKRILLICISVCTTLLPYLSYSQTQVESGFEIQEVLKIAEMYKNVPNLSFNIDYKYTDSVNVDSTLEHLTGYSKISEGRYYTFLDSTEYIQGFQYNLSVFHRDSAIMVNNRQEYSDIMKFPVLDSLFNSAYVDSMKVFSINETTNTLYLYLSPASPYGDYTLTYDKTNYRIKKIQFFIRHVPTDEGVTSGTAVMTISMTDFTTNAISQDTFWEDKFIYKQGGELLLKPMYSGYQLLDNTTIKTTLPQ
jgi:hypothetical protein